MKIELLVIYRLIAIKYPVRAKREMSGLILDVFWPIQADIMVGEPLRDTYGNPLLSPNTFTQDNLM